MTHPRLCLSVAHLVIPGLQLNSQNPEIFARSAILPHHYLALFGPLTGPGNQAQLTHGCLGIYMGDTGGEGWN